MKKMLLLLSGTLLLASCHIVKAYRYRNFELKDLDRMGAMNLPAMPSSFSFTVDTSKYPRMGRVLDSQLLNTQTYAFMIVRNDTVLYERYFGEVNDSTRLPSFSVAKSVTGTLVGKALEEGFIKSLDEPVTRYVPELANRDGRFNRVTIQHVLDMRSGVKSNEDYGSPFSDVLKLGFAGNVSKPVLRLKTEAEPGEMDYKSVNTQLLAMIVERATGRKLQDYAQQKLWAPIGMEHPATWNTDRHNTVRAFCCLNMAARDYARFGRLYLRKGDWNGSQVITKDWVNRSVSADTMRKYDGYRNQWWSGSTVLVFTDSTEAVAAMAIHPGATTAARSTRTGIRYFQVEYSDGAYHAEGILGQFIYVNPSKNLIIVRLGHNWSHPHTDAEGFIYAIGAQL